MKEVRISDVARHAGVSNSTVSQYLNGRYEYMRIDTKNRIAKSIEDLEYQPNALARSLRQKTTKTIGVIVANILHTFSTQIIRSIEDHCQKMGYHIIVCNADENPVKEEKYINMLYAKQVDGLITFPINKNIDLYRELQNKGFPIVFLDRIIPEANISSVLLDNEKAAKIAVEEFVSKSYKNIAIITTSFLDSVTPRIERINGFKKAIKENNLYLDKNYLKSVDAEEIQSTFEEMMNLQHPPKAVLAGNDFVLIEILKYIKKNKIIIPKDIAVIGIDDVPFADLYNPPITTIKQPTFKMGKIAAEILLNKIKKNNDLNIENIYRGKPEILRRFSC